MSRPDRLSEDFVISLFKEDQSLSKGEVGIGDDAAVWPLSEGVSALVTTDLLVENIHFLRSEIPPRDLGYKSLAVNLSDIAAMGGLPRKAFLSIALPRDLSPEWVEEWKEGFRDLAREFSIQLMGGDTAASPGPIFINLTVFGTASPTTTKLRSTAQAGDFIYLTGPLGDSRAGLQILLNAEKNRGDLERELIGRHHRPRPHVEEGRWLGERAEVTAMMDVSDGLRRDLGRLARSSKVGFEVQVEDVPLSEELRRFAGEEAAKIACDGGEDYVLLFTARPERSAELAVAFEKNFNRPLKAIGRILPDVENSRFLLNGKPWRETGSSFEHF